MVKRHLQHKFYLTTVANFTEIVTVANFTGIVANFTRIQWQILPEYSGKFYQNTVANFTRIQWQILLEYSGKFEENIKSYWNVFLSLNKGNV